MKLVKLLSNLLKALTVVIFSALIFVVLIQITGRYTSFSFVWTEEVSRFLFIFAIAVSAPLAMEKREYVRVDFLLEVIPDQIKKYVDAVIYLIIGCFSAFLIYYAYEFALLGQNQSSATLAVEMYYINLSMVILFVLLALYSFINIFAVLKNSQEEGVRQ
ncbi:TRAP transporter small permease [Halobacillus sp. Marseille-P3879]|uniref:TRAP transporter small permease n=1 Tax=Halobacillus TaxID=45667 RepID=UPI001359CF14|nr:TRAP transporter small permease [Halobacillus sp. Marseille-P3879]